MLRRLEGDILAKKLRIIEVRACLGKADSVRISVAHFLSDPSIFSLSLAADKYLPGDFSVTSLIIIRR